MSIVAELRAVVADAKEQHPQLLEGSIWESALACLTKEQQAEVDEEISAEAIRAELQAAREDTGEKGKLLERILKAQIEYGEVSEFEQEWFRRVEVLGNARRQLTRRVQERQAVLDDLTQKEIEQQIADITNASNGTNFEIRNFADVDQLAHEVHNAKRTLDALDGGLILGSRETHQYWEIRKYGAEAQALNSMADFLDHVTMERAQAANQIQGGQISIDTTNGKSGWFRRAAKRAAWNFHAGSTNFRPTILTNLRFN